MKFEPYIVSDHAPVLLKASKKTTLRDSMTLGDIVKELGPGWISSVESVGIVTWSFDDHSELQVWPSSYTEEGVVTFRKTGAAAGVGMMWFEKKNLSDMIIPKTTDARESLLKSFELGKTITTYVELLDRKAKPCAPNVSLRLAAVDHLYRHFKEMSFALWIENPDAAPAEVCLMPFSTIGAPLIDVHLKNAKDEDLLQAPPEIYPQSGEKVAFQRFTLPGHSRVLILQPLQMNSSDGLKDRPFSARWTIILNGDYKNGSLSISE